MTERKPPGVPTGSWVDRLVREAQERGEFDNLPGAGKPLPGLDKPLDENWWLRQKIRDEDLPSDALLPPVMQLRREVASLPETVRDLPDEASVRAAVSEVNMRIADWIRSPSGPVLPIGRADVEDIVRTWRAQRAGATSPTARGEEAVTPPETEVDPATSGLAESSRRGRRASWWRRRQR